MPQQASKADASLLGTMTEKAVCFPQQVTGFQHCAKAAGLMMRKMPRAAQTPDGCIQP